MPATRLRFDQSRNTIVSPTDTGRQNGYAPTGLAGASVLRMAGTGSTVLSGLAGGEDGRELLLLNASDGLLLLEHESTGSTAGNRFSLGGPPRFMMPGDSITLFYDGTASRWRPRGIQQTLASQFNTFDDFFAITGTWATSLSGTGTSGVTSTGGVDSAEKALGAFRVNLGTAATARAYITSSSVSMVGALGACLHVARVVAENPPTSGLQYEVNVGLTDGAVAVSPSNGAYWRGYWNAGASAPYWARATGSTSDDDTGVGNISSNYIWLITYLNPAWSRADYIYSHDSVAFNVSGSRSTSMPTSGTQLRPIAGMWKTSGTTNRAFSADFMGLRYDVQRG
jgi:hypothetical protein